MLKKIVISIIIINISFSLFPCLIEIDSVDKLIYESKSVFYAEIIGSSKYKNVKDTWGYYDLSFKVKQTLKGSINKDIIKVRIYGFKLKQKKINKNIKKLKVNNFYLFLSDQNYGSNYCEKYFKVKKDYDFVPTSYMSPTSIFDFGLNDQLFNNSIINSNIEDVIQKKMHNYIIKMINYFDENIKIEFKSINLTDSEIEKLNSITDKSTTDHQEVYYLNILFNEKYIKRSTITFD